MLKATQAHFDRLSKLYTDTARKDKLHGLIVGEKGGGKTSLALTCPKPVLVHSFDPGGTEVLRDEKGKLIDGIFVDTRFEVDSMRDPKAYLLWENEFNQLGRDGFFSSLGTFILDSTTTFGTCLLWQIMKKEGRTPPAMNVALEEKSHGMRIQDWGTVLNVMLMLSRQLAALPCHTILLGHVGKEKDEVTGRFVKSILFPGQAREQLPINLHELYILINQNTPKGIERKLLTQNDGEYLATTRMGRRGLFDKYEQPDIRALLKKAGYPSEDVK